MFQQSAIFGALISTQQSVIAFRGGVLGLLVDYR